jgi:hypothetical protein
MISNGRNPEGINFSKPPVLTGGINEKEKHNPVVSSISNK